MLPDEAVRLPASHYYDEAQAAAESDRIFSRSPVCAGPAGVLRVPGDYQLAELNGKAIILLRNAAGQVRAFLNACRHRRAPLLTESQGRVLPVSPLVL